MLLLKDVSTTPWLSDCGVGFMYLRYPLLVVAAIHHLGFNLRILICLVLVV